ncbi:MAG: hypothetical protein RSA01_04215 [Clostridium sp.]|uniref:hypothetical protein n=1 Tax=Clostridium sp. TaxID=1506 RepID=UPI002FC8EE3A
MRVCYDKEKDIVSVYFGEENTQENIDTSTQKENIPVEENVYNSEEAASLILDTVDIVENDQVIGFRVYKASLYYDKHLLEAADLEIIPPEDLNRPTEKVIAVVSSGGVLN